MRDLLKQHTPQLILRRREDGAGEIWEKSSTGHLTLHSVYDTFEEAEHEKRELESPQSQADILNFFKNYRI